MPTGSVMLCDILSVPRVREIVFDGTPAWLWDGPAGRILFANAAGVAFFRTAGLTALQARRFDVSRPGLMPLARAATSLPRDGAPRLATLRFFVGARDIPLLCSCRLVGDRMGPNWVLVEAAQPSGDERSLEAQAAVLFDGWDEPVRLHGEYGLLYENPAARAGSGGAAGQTVELDGTGQKLRLEIGGAMSGTGGDAPREDAMERETDDAGQVREVAPQAWKPDVPGDPRRFSFVLDEAGRFVEVGPALAKAVGARSAALTGRSWRDVADARGLDTDGAIAAALADRQPWEAEALDWPTDTGQTARVHLAAHPRLGEGGAFVGYRGFGTVVATEVGTASEAACGGAGGAPSPATDAAARNAAALNEVEVSAFRAIAEALKADGGAGVAPAAHAGLGDDGDGDDADPSPGQSEERHPAHEEHTGEADSVLGGVLDRLPLGVAVLRDDRIVYANPAMLDMFGYSDLDDLEIAGGAASLFTGERDTDSGTVIAHRQDGDAFAVESQISVIPWFGAMATLLTVRPAPPAEPDQAQADEIAELRAILDTATDGVLVLSSEGRVETVNRSAEALFGREAGEMVGHGLEELVAEESRQTVRDYVLRVVLGGVEGLINDGCEVVARTSGGEAALFLTLGRLGDSASPRFCALLRDLTEWKAAEAELVAARRRAEEASAQKSDFLARMSHEIRTPLNAIVGFAEVMLEERFGPIGTERYREYVRDMRASGEHIMSLVNDLLDLSKVEAGRLELDFTDLDLNDIVEQSVAIMQPQANSGRVIIRNSLARHLPPVVADSRSMRQVMLNLLSNAIKFTPPGGQVFVSTGVNSEGRVTLRVRDTGIGMSEGDIETALEPFRQLAVRPEYQQQGTGLGLPLTRALVEANQAEFAIRSRPDEGTLVEIGFPQARVSAAE